MSIWKMNETNETPRVQEIIDAIKMVAPNRPASLEVVAQIDGHEQEERMRFKIASITIDDDNSVVFHGYGAYLIESHTRKTLRDLFGFEAE